MSIKPQAFSGGFGEPVFESQSMFRLLMDGMARPGMIRTVSSDVGQPEPLGGAAGAIALTLCDHETPVWLSAGLAKSSVGEWMVFHTGAPVTREKAEARFAFVEAGATLASFGLFAAGTQEYPDRSTTLMIEVAALDEGQQLTLTGPGIQDATTARVRGLPDVFPRLWAENRALFPRGIDVILTAGKTLLCLPRTTKIAVQ
ncbi:phosphonate C-P lyase system protein PhnH [Neorhizobium sp. Rsf11]|uniref:Phosphonate C-P lyase system protein PhnH n=2 Tax=Neorhizobium TaxID=1525371 RepID=A0ABV0M9U7_9HYPH|nr:phosphonate C-P lyase system protein PhnH [Neorhizobium petrolearium]MCC2613245.1 phosphonate C-P lyase system protein PhnH [Neorhizobium petrolearium]WGI68335.1 phosphonate C-P lyase system protein PhnH [Neorhizobium petrolearium]